MSTLGGEPDLAVTLTILASKDQTSCDLADEVVILALKPGVYYGLESVGARIWRLIQQPRTIGEIQEIVIEEYDVDPGRFGQDLMALLRELEAAGLINVLPGLPS